MMQRISIPRLCIPLIGGLTFWLAACGSSSSNHLLQLSFEAMPGAGVALAQGTVDTQGADYGEKEAFTQQVFNELFPDIVTAVGIDSADIDSELSPGGFLLETNPSMQAQLRGDEAAATADSERLAAALGYVMYQWSVLITDFGTDVGDTRYVAIRFTGGDLNATSAQEFFAFAAGIESGLGGGYSVFGDEMLFLNVRGDDGVPFSGLDDDVFAQALGQAAAEFTGTAVEVAESGMVIAQFIENDWDSASAGQEYRARLDAAMLEALEPLRVRFDQLLDAASAEYGWPRGAAEATIEETRRGRGAELWRWRLGAEASRGPGAAMLGH